MSVPSTPPVATEDAVAIVLPSRLIKRIFSHAEARDAVDTSTAAASAAGLPVDLDSPEHAALFDDAVALLDDVVDAVEESPVLQAA